MPSCRVELLLLQKAHRCRGLQVVDVVVPATEAQVEVLRLPERPVRFRHLWLVQETDWVREPEVLVNGLEKLTPRTPVQWHRVQEGSEWFRPRRRRRRGWWRAGLPASRQHHRESCQHVDILSDHGRQNEPERQAALPFHEQGPHLSVVHEQEPQSGEQLQLRREFPLARKPPRAEHGGEEEQEHHELRAARGSERPARVMLLRKHVREPKRVHRVERVQALR